MSSASKYRVLLDRFFILNGMEKTAVIKLRHAFDANSDEEARLIFKQELQLIQEEKVKLLADLQALLLATGTTPLPSPPYTPD